MISNSATILYADDDENDAFLVCRAFRKSSLPEPRVVLNGREAIDYLARAIHSETPTEGFPVPDLVLLDLNMPFRTGMEVLDWARQQPRYAATPILIFTSSNQAKDVAEAYAKGATAYVMKPNSVERLAEFGRLIRDGWASGHFDPGPLRRLATYQLRD